MATPTPEEELANWEALQAEFRRAATSSPAWFVLADHCISALMADRIAALKSQQSSTLRSPGE